MELIKPSTLTFSQELMLAMKAKQEMDANLFIQTNGTGIRKLLKQKVIK